MIGAVREDPLRCGEVRKRRLRLERRWVMPKCGFLGAKFSGGIWDLGLAGLGEIPSFLPKSCGPKIVQSWPEYGGPLRRPRAFAIFWKAAQMH